MVFRALKEKASDLYDSGVVKAKVACGLARDMYGTIENKINQTARKHPTMAKMAPFMPIILYVGVNALDAASDLVMSSAVAQNITVGDDGIGIRDGIIRFLSPDFAASDVKIYGVAEGQDPVRISHGAHESNSCLDFLLRDSPTDAFPRYMVEANGAVYTVTDEQIASGNGIHSIGGASSTGGGSDGGFHSAEYIYGALSGLVIGAVMWAVSRKNKNAKVVDEQFSKIDDMMDCPDELDIDLGDEFDDGYGADYDLPVGDDLIEEENALNLRD